MPTENDPANKKKTGPKSGPKYKPIPAALSQKQLDDIDEIAKKEKMTRSEIIRRAVEAFTFNYKTDVLDQRQLEMEKKMKKMEDRFAGLLTKSIRISGQSLYFATLPYTKGLPKQRLNAAAFQDLYDKSGAFAAQFLDSTAAGKVPKHLMLLEDEKPGAEE